MRVRIIRQSTEEVNGVSLRHYRPGEVYDLAPTIAEYLVVEKYAIVEMRNPLRSEPVPVERRRT